MSFTTRTGLAAGFLATAVTLGCGPGDKPAAQPPATMAPATTMAPAATLPMVTSGDFGVAECDNYMKKYMACVDSKVPESARAMMRQQLDQTKAAWKQAASTPQGKSSLASACAQMDAQSGPAMKAYGCSW
jgi:hypothetical protein